MAVNSFNAQNPPVNTKGDLFTFSTIPTKLGVGTTGQVLTADSTTATGLKWATPATSSAKSFTNRTPKIDSSNFQSIAYNGSNLYVAAGTNGLLATSSDGKTWTSRTSGFGSNNILSVAYGNGIWVAVGANGTLTTSTDGTTWTARTANMSTNSINHVVYANSTFVAVGDGGGSTNTGGIISSTDGITWTRKSQTPTIGTRYYCVNWNGTNWQVGAQLSTNNFLYATTPQGTWTTANDGTIGTDIVGIWYDGTNTFYSGANTNQWAFSSNLLSSGQLVPQFVRPTDNWPTSTGQAINAATFYNGRFYIANGGYLFDFNSTPFATNQFERSPHTLSPTLNSNTTSPFWTATRTCVFVGAIGEIYGGISNNIYTSF